jgi:hypothetical protein
MNASRRVISTAVPCVLGVLALHLGCSSGVSSGGSGAGASSGGAAGATSSVSGADSGVAPTLSPLLCAPSSTEVAACGGMAVGDGCTLGDSDGGTTRSIAGTCRATLDGSQVACIRNPPSAPALLSDACTGKATGDACAVGPDGGARSFQGACVSTPSGAALVCLPVRPPPQRAVDACTGKASGDACEIAGWADGKMVAGTCGTGSTGSGPLACRPAHDRTAILAAACSGRDAGAACGLGPKADFGLGVCTTPAEGGAELCVLPCSDFGFERRFHRPEGREHGWP